MRKLAFLAVVCCVVATACSDRLADSRLAGPSFQHLATSCPSPTTIQNGIKAIFPRGGDARSSALSRFNQIVKEVGRGDTAAARVHAIQLTEFIVNKYEDGRLIGGQSITTQATLAQVLNGILCIADLPQVFGPGSLGDDGAAAFIYPTSGDTDVVTGTEWAGVHIPAASVVQPALVTIQRLPDFPGPLLTQLDQYPIYYEFHSTEPSFTNDVVVGVCLAENAAPPDLSRLRVAHNVAPYTMGSIEIAPLAFASFIDCTDAPLAAGSSRWGFDLARTRALLGRGLARLLLPTPAYAWFGTGVGGTVRTFSPFGIVDTLGIVTPTVRTSGGGTWPGDLMDYAPSLRVTTPTGRPMVGIPVSFAVTAGGGTIGAGAAATDAAGAASAGSWRLGPLPGPNAVTATVQSSPGTGFAGSPLLFQATGIAP